MKYVIWDWNGTLFDDLDLCLYCINRLLYNNGYKPLPTLEAYKKVFGFPISEYYKRAGFDFSKKSYMELADEYLDMYLPMAKLCSLNKDAVATLEGFKQKGYKQYILSATELSNLKAQVERYPIGHYFDNLLGTGDVYAASKAQLAYNFLEEHKDTEELIYIGDTYHDLEVANILRAKTFLYNGGHQIIKPAQGYTVINSLLEAIP